MKNKDIQSYLMKTIPLDKLYVTGDNNHIKIVAIGKIFEGINNVQKQQIIYKPLTKYIIEKKIHAISIHTFTLKEWKKKNTTKQ
ncbi:BolA family protein [Buchnera aphidicola]|uniref:BolA/IbaG family iron-sulfur metabolism protein n=1 Tax=Buchnera aphidicola (Stegophylla sp.) TaxID=2315800 RepID=A0A4D6Y9L6_9GAMM|nr:BolA/IbaG family iron-sulfur metabolism protein [Buchnera aphidicola (Stegophylla sp.)]QCI26407.1 BolA/IbaG family iron-sulfur metabolism protein [Buchnera aphidicola (Stegophylla sp.)]